MVKTKKMKIMKNKILMKIGAFVLLVMMFSSCNSWIDTDINVSPNRPVDVPMNLLLPSVEARTAFNVVGSNDYTRTVSMWIQHTTGVSRQSQAEGAYILRSGDVNNMWNSVYAGALMDAKQIIIKAQAEETKSPHFEGVAKIIQAIILGYSTDVWNDIPWTEALQGKENLTPVFDSQQAIYSAIQSLLDEGISLCSQPAENNIIQLDGDIIYGNDASMWVKAAWAMKARYALHLAKRNGDKAYSDALEYAGKAFSSNLGNMYYYYSSSSDNNANPLYLFMQDRGDIRMCYTLIDSLKRHSDPRLGVFAYPVADTIFDGNDTILPGDYYGARPGQPVIAASAPGPGIASNNSPTQFITYAELEFIKAEAHLGLGHYDQAKDAYKSALKASLVQYGVYDDAWYQGYSSIIDMIPNNMLLKALMTEKWISLTYRSESFVDWRRTGYPKLTPNPEAATQEIPRRFPYPTDALTYNPNTPDLGNEPLWKNVWWDTGNPTK